MTEDSYRRKRRQRLPHRLVPTRIISGVSSKVTVALIAKTTSLIIEDLFFSKFSVFNVYLDFDFREFYKNTGHFLLVFSSCTVFLL